MPKNNTPPKPHPKASNDDGVILHLTPRQQLRFVIKAMPSPFGRGRTLPA